MPFNMKLLQISNPDVPIDFQWISPVLAVYPTMLPRLLLLRSNAEAGSSLAASNPVPTIILGSSEYVSFVASSKTATAYLKLRPFAPPTIFPPTFKVPSSCSELSTAPTVTARCTVASARCTCCALRRTVQRVGPAISVELLSGLFSSGMFTLRLRGPLGRPPGAPLSPSVYSLFRVN
jgi:hypothetical protein